MLPLTNKQFIGLHILGDSQACESFGNVNTMGLDATYLIFPYACIAFFPMNPETLRYACFEKVVSRLESKVGCPFHIFRILWV
jgi:hypothetical protein